MVSFDIAIKLHQDGKIDAAEKAYLEILAEKPDHPGALHLLGVIRQQQGKPADAIELIGRAIRLRPNAAVHHNNYGAALLSLDRFAEAEVSFRRALELRPKYADALANLGSTRAALGDEPGAETSFRCALQCEPAHRDATTRLAELLQRHDRMEEARELLETAIAAAPCPQFHLALGNVCLAAGNALRAAEHYRAAILGSAKPRSEEGAVQLPFYEGRRLGIDSGCQRSEVDGQPQKVAFISPHCVLDFTNGAATATLDGLKLLNALGFGCQAFCGTRIDAWDKSGGAFDDNRVFRDAQVGSFRARVLFASHGDENLRIMPNSPDARKFLAATRLLLMPSLVENAALVAMEAMFNGIPVLASNRGGLPETVAGQRSEVGGRRSECRGGFLFDIPARYTPETRDVPTTEEVEPWVETIIRLWDDPGEYDRASRAARERAERWHPDRLAPLYRGFFSRFAHQRRPPLVPSEVTRQ